MSKKMDSKFRNELVAHAVAQLLKDLSNSTWGECHFDGLKGLLDYRQDMAETISRAIFVQNDKEQSLPRQLLSDAIKKEYYAPSQPPIKGNAFPDLQGPKGG